MATSIFKLVEKKSLTFDVFELIFKTQENLNSIPGQFITFLLPKTKFARAYSILFQN
jgi:ferredoxin-NADP reductase